jgi:hypothetical protein
MHGVRYREGCVRVMYPTHPVKSVCSPLSYSSSPGVNVSHRRGCCAWLGSVYALLAVAVRKEVEDQLAEGERTSERASGPNENSACIYPVPTYLCSACICMVPVPTCICRYE